MSSISQWSTTAASNNSAAPDGWPEGMAPSDVNDAARENMAAIRTFYDSIEWREWGHTITYGSATTFTTAAGDGDTTGVYHAGRRIRAVGTTTGTIYGTISSSTHSTTTTVTIGWDSGTLQNETLTISVGWAVDTLSDQGIESGTVMWFYQASAPTGWTIKTDVDDRMLIVDDENGGTTGGSEGPTSFTVSISGTTGSESGHTHSVSGTTSTQSQSQNVDTVTQTGSVADTHTHTFSVTSGSGSSHSHSFSDTDGVSLKYAAGIFATKD